MFYSDILDLAEKREVTVMTEKWDNDGTHFSTGADLREFLDYMDCPYLAACFPTVCLKNKKTGDLR